MKGSPTAGTAYRYWAAASSSSWVVRSSTRSSTLHTVLTLPASSLLASCVRRSPLTRQQLSHRRFDRAHPLRILARRLMRCVICVLSRQGKSGMQAVINENGCHVRLPAGRRCCVVDRELCERQLPLPVVLAAVGIPRSVSPITPLARSTFVLVFLLFAEQTMRLEPMLFTKSRNILVHGGDDASPHRESGVTPPVRLRTWLQLLCMSSPSPPAKMQEALMMANPCRGASLRRAPVDSRAPGSP